MSRPSAGQQVIQNEDILFEIVRYLDVPSQYPFLLTSKTCAIVLLPILYRTLRISTDTPPVLLDLSPEEVGNVEKGEGVGGWTKRSVWAAVRTLDVSTHYEHSCPGLHPHANQNISSSSKPTPASTSTSTAIPTSPPSSSPAIAPGALPNLPNLRNLILSGGSKDLSKGKECQPHSCPLIAHYSPHLKTLSIRSIIPLADLPNVHHLTMVLRPCQFPFEPRGESVVVAGTTRPLSGLRRVDIVLWDEEHEKRVDWAWKVEYPWTAMVVPPGNLNQSSHMEHRDAAWSGDEEDEDGAAGQIGDITDRTGILDTDTEIRHSAVANPTSPAPEPLPLQYRPRGPKPSRSLKKPPQDGPVRYKTKGCNYCDQQGCVRYTPNIPKQLAGLAYTCSRYSQVSEIGIWNSEKSLGRFQWWDSKFDIGGCYDLIRKESKRGWEERKRSMQVDESTVKNAERGDKVFERESAPVVSFHDAEEWATRVEKEGLEVWDKEEMGYWREVVDEAGNLTTGI